MSDVQTVANEAEHIPLSPEVAFNKRAILDALKAAGVDHAVIEFDGGGDEGLINAHMGVPPGQVEVMDASCPNETPTFRLRTMQQAMEEMVFDLLTWQHCGWENNEGGYGVVRFDPGADKITLDFSERFTETQYHEHEV